MEYYETIIIYNGKLSEDEYNLKVEKYIKVLLDLGSKIKSAERILQIWMVRCVHLCN